MTAETVCVSELFCFYNKVVYYPPQFSGAWWYSSVTQHLVGWQEEEQKFKATIGHRLNMRPPWVI